MTGGRSRQRDTTLSFLDAIVVFSRPDADVEVDENAVSSFQQSTDNEGTHDAQQLFLELSEHALTSTFTIITATELLSYVTTAALGCNTWNGTTMAFVLHWEEQVRSYERYVGTHSHFSP
eukprot:CAMPEP_0170380102 /NCGR_PEP_ID=MMETSP0117_2-20130122/13694_1 /TAXON_ID=400756 /ORGANISM="Durinskia baltica, Strain CSIRO CS-38" /LENGTH=119 /DNA_ID=CAMNT_0010635579 /DNA_START=2 /DNA_END=358 /DNA_ORIENTATION=+